MSVDARESVRTQADLPAPQASGNAAADVLTSMVHLIRTTRAVGHRQTDGLVIAGTPLGILRKLGVGDARPSDLACSLQIAPSVVSRAVVTLEKAGLVERRPDPADARAWHLTLTDLGRERLSARQADINEQFADLLADWDPLDVAQLATLMHRLDVAIAARGDDSSPIPPEPPAPDTPEPDIPEPDTSEPDTSEPDTPAHNRTRPDRRTCMSTSVATAQRADVKAVPSRET